MLFSLHLVVIELITSLSSRDQLISLTKDVPESLVELSRRYHGFHSPSGISNERFEQRNVSVVQNSDEEFRVWSERVRRIVKSRVAQEGRPASLVSRHLHFNLLMVLIVSNRSSGANSHTQMTILERLKDSYEILTDPSIDQKPARCRKFLTGNPMLLQRVRLDLTAGGRCSIGDTVKIVRS